MGDKVPKEGVHHTCIVCTSFWFCYENKKKDYPQVYLEECNYKIKKKKMSEFIDLELEEGSDSE